MQERRPYPSDVSDDEWAFVAPYLTLMKEDAPQREHCLREVFNGLRWIVRSGAEWRLMPPGTLWVLPPWHTVYQQTQRWLRAGVFEAVVHDLRMLLRELEGRPPNHVPPSSTAGRCSRVQKVEVEPATTGTSVGRAARRTWLWTHWGNCWRWL